MAPAPTEADLAFNAAFAAYKAALSDADRSDAAPRLRAQLDRQKLQVQAAHQRQKVAREELYAAELALLQEQLRRDLKENDDVTAFQLACVDLCRSKLESDPEEASLFANVILSWAPPRSLSARVKETWEECWKRSRFYGVLPEVRVIYTHLSKATPEQVQRMSANAGIFLKNRGFNLPASELYAALNAGVRIERKRESNLKYWTEKAAIVSGAVGGVSAVVSTLQILKPEEEDRVLPEDWYSF